MMNDNDTDNLEAGIETNSPIESGIEENHDVYYYIDDGEFAYIIGATNVNELADENDVSVEDGKDLYHLQHYVCEAGLVDEYSATSTHQVPEGQIDSYLSEYVSEIGTAEEAIEAAREYWTDR